MSHFHASLFVHLIWTTYRRMPVLDEPLAHRVHRRLTALSTQHGSPLAVSGVADHVHLLIALHPTASISTLVQSVKASSSQWLTNELRDATFAWQSGYGVFSVSEEDLERVREYVLRQPEHHAARTTIPAWERTSPHLPPIH
jgi:REP element-mobilizing transposase RayT